MQIGEASKILAQMYRGALPGEKVVAVHLFGIMNADQIRNIPAKQIAVRADLPESYGTEIRKGINLAKYVEVRRQSR